MVNFLLPTHKKHARPQKSIARTLWVNKGLETMAGGRPTSYKPEYCERVIELGKQGYSITEMACDLDVVKSTLYEWAKNNVEFSNALSRAVSEAQSWYEKIGRENLTADKFQSSLWAKQVSCRFPADYREKTEVTTINVTPEEALRQLMGENG